MYSAFETVDESRSELIGTSELDRSDIEVQNDPVYILELVARVHGIIEI